MWLLRIEVKCQCRSEVKLALIVRRRWDFQIHGFPSSFCFGSSAYMKHVVYYLAEISPTEKCRNMFEVRVTSCHGIQSQRPMRIHISERWSILVQFLLYFPVSIPNMGRLLGESYYLAVLPRGLAFCWKLSLSCLGRPLGMAWVYINADSRCRGMSGGLKRGVSPSPSPSPISTCVKVR